MNCFQWVFNKKDFLKCVFNKKKSFPEYDHFPILAINPFHWHLGCLPLWCNQATGLSEELVSCPIGHGLRERKGRSAWSKKRPGWCWKGETVKRIPSSCSVARDKHNGCLNRQAAIFNWQQWEGNGRSGRLPADTPVWSQHWDPFQPQPQRQRLQTQPQRDFKRCGDTEAPRGSLWNAG